MVVVERSCGYRARGVGIRGKFVKPGVQDVVVAMWQNVVLYPEVKDKIRDLVRVVGIVDRLVPRGVNSQGNFVLSSPKR